MKYKKRTNRKRLSVDLPIKLFEMIKNASYDNHCTITKYVITALMHKLQLEGRHKNNED